MPTYTYRCNACGNQFEVRQRISEPPVSECPVCGGMPRRVVSQVGIVFKGSGFYVTDNRGSSGRVTTSTTASSSAPDTEGSASTGAEAKPAATEKSEKKTETSTSAN